METLADKFLREKAGNLKERFPIWKWKLTKDDYFELKDYLKQKLESFNANPANIARLYSAIGREVVIYYSEFWRREYNGDSEKEKAAFNALKICTTNDFEVLFYHFKQSAKYGYNVNDVRYSVKPGWQRLGMQLDVDIYQYVGKKALAHSMFFQGGMPMNCILNGTSERWKKFVDTLLSDRVNYEELDMTTIANYVSGPRSFCQQLEYAFEENREAYRAGFPSDMKPELMPFHCKDHTDEWYVGIMQKCILSSNSNDSRGVLPFQLKWMVDFCDEDRNIAYIFCRITNKSYLSDSFITNNALDKEAIQEFRLSCGDEVIEDFCKQYSPDSKSNMVALDCEPFEFDYNNQGCVSVFCASNHNVVIERDLDLSRPLVLLHDYQSRYQILNGTNIFKLGRSSFRLILPAGWELVSKIEGAKEELFKCNGMSDNPTIVFIPAGNHSAGFSVKNTQTGEELRFYSDSAEEELCVRSSFIGYKIRSIDNLPLVMDSSRASFVIKSKNEETAIRNGVEFCSYENASQWHDTMPTGRIIARVSKENGEYIISDRFINIEGLDIKVIDPKEHVCRIAISMPRFVIEVEGGQRDPHFDNEWTVDYNKLTDKRYINIKFIHMDTHRTFTLRHEAPFRVCAIYNAMGEKLNRYSCIPLSDLSSYTYRIDDNDYNYVMKLGDISIQLTKDADSLLCKELQSQERLGSLPIEGALNLLTGNSFDFSTPTLLTLERYATFGAARQHPFLYLTIAKSPILVKRIGNSISFFYQDISTIDEETQRPRERETEYKGSLTLVDVEDLKEIDVRYQEGGHIIPEEVMLQGRSYIIIGKVPGHISPRFEDLSMEVTTQERRKENAETVWNKLNESYTSSRMFDPIWTQALNWYYLAVRENVKYDLFLDLKFISQNPKLLAMLTWHLLLNCQKEEEKNEVALQMMNLFGGSNGPFVFMLHSREAINILEPKNYPDIKVLFNTESDTFKMGIQKWRLEHLADEDLSLAAYAQSIWQTLDNLRLQ